MLVASPCKNPSLSIFESCSLSRLPLAVGAHLIPEAPASLEQGLQLVPIRSDAKSRRCRPLLCLSMVESGANSRYLRSRYAFKKRENRGVSRLGVVEFLRAELRASTTAKGVLSNYRAPATSGHGPPDGPLQASSARAQHLACADAAPPLPRGPPVQLLGREKCQRPAAAADSEEHPEQALLSRLGADMRHQLWAFHLLLGGPPEDGSAFPAPPAGGVQTAPPSFMCLLSDVAAHAFLASPSCCSLLCMHPPRRPPSEGRLQVDAAVSDPPARETLQPLQQQRGSSAPSFGHDPAAAAAAAASAGLQQEGPLGEALLQSVVLQLLQLDGLGRGLKDERSGETALGGPLSRSFGGLADIGTSRACLFQSLLLLLLGAAYLAFLTQLEGSHGPHRTLKAPLLQQQMQPHSEKHPNEPPGWSQEDQQEAHPRRERDCPSFGEFVSSLGAQVASGLQILQSTQQSAPANPPPGASAETSVAEASFPEGSSSDFMDSRGVAALLRLRRPLWTGPDASFLLSATLALQNLLLQCSNAVLQVSLCLQPNAVRAQCTGAAAVA
ncbi:uncharacterized protein LOC113147396, partial [Cyclospora cayetanensis]|uniref:Uncharacterized protein LOC113147396 n=1 Tax=Cyclospora cayetanensis TaxID=88456 RepID=A0A6P6S2V4_9EIME